jgi:hypothetical protein
VEHYTPRDIVERVRSVFGGVIDLDPASCPEANEVVRAKTFFTKEQDGLSLPWNGKVFLNPPGGRTSGNKSSQKAWYWRLAQQYESGSVEEAVFIAFSIEVMQTTQVQAESVPPIRRTFCIPSRRIAYNTPGGGRGKSPPHASAILYLGKNKSLFRECFESLGAVVVQ